MLVIGPETRKDTSLGVFFIKNFGRGNDVTEAVFDKVGDQFVAYYDTVRGYVREQLTRQNLSPFVGQEPMDVLDVGGGDGRDAIWFASQGHRVRLVDPSPVMLGKARQAVSQEALDGLITIEEGDPNRVLAGADASYDLVLSHGVLMYLDDPQDHLDLLGKLVKPGGIVSVLTKGKAGSLFRLLHKRDIQAATILQASDRLTNNLGENVLAVNEAAFRVMLKLAHLSLWRSFGVRIATEFDYRRIAELPDGELASIINIEAGLGSDESTKGLGQMLHFISKPEGDQS